jgi:hypothetical protein
LDSSPLTDALTPTENIATSNSTLPVQIQTKKEVIIEKISKLTLSKCIGSIHILPIVKETYNKECQTDEVEDFDDVEDIQETPRRGSMNRIQSSGLSASINRGAPGYVNYVFVLIRIVKFLEKYAVFIRPFE